MTVIVLPEIQFHYQLIDKEEFNDEPILTNVNDFVIWQFKQTISHNVIQLSSDETLEEIQSCHERAIKGRNRSCLAVECIKPGVFFFANPGKVNITAKLEK